MRRVATEAMAKCRAQREAERARKAATAAEEAERNKPKFFHTPCDLSSHDWRPLGHWGHHDECQRCGARLQLETGIVWAMVDTGATIRIGQLERAGIAAGHHQLWRPVTTPGATTTPVAKAKSASRKR